MHREFDPAIEPFSRRSAGGVFLLTSLLVILLAFDLWPLLANWLAGFGWEIPSRSRELFGVRFALIAAVIGGTRALFSALDRAADGQLSADLAIAIACLAAILLGEPLVAAEVVVIGLIGECLEAAVFDRTQKALRSLAELFPLRTWALRDGVETRVFTSQLAVGDTVIVKPGGKIPVDGTVIDGASTVNTAALTGESLPVDKTVGDAVLAGCVNQNGVLTIRAEKLAKQTVAGRVIEMTEKALQDKAPLERYADRLAKKFLPAVLVLAVLVFAFNMAVVLGPWSGAKSSWSAAGRVSLYPTLAVLVVACPCPLVLATPAAMIAALGRLAGTGVLLKGGAALERLAAIGHVAFDKTGTLTTAELTIQSLTPVGISEEDLLRTAATAEQGSEHPLAKLLLSEARKRQLSLTPLDSFLAHPGGGVEAAAGGETILVGTRLLLESKGISVVESHAGTTLHVATGGVYLGSISAADTVRPEAAGIIEELKSLGLGVSLISGDRAIVAEATAKNLGIDSVRAEVLPGEKAAALPANAAFVGDGINDAPALATASVGIAIGGGTDVAAETGDVVMMGEPLRPLPFLIRLARFSMNIVRQNILWFGFGVNLAGVIITGFLWPLFAPNAAWFESAPLFGAVWHQIGSLLVLLNSMRILSFEKLWSNNLNLRMKSFDRWLNTLHPEEWLHGVTHHWKPVAGAAAGVAVIAWLMSGFTQVNADEVGVVQRFGAVKGELAPGLHLRWPWPVESTAKVKPLEVKTVPLGFRMLSEEARQKLAQVKAEQQRLRNRDATWSAAHADEIARLSDESVMLTGDGNLIEVMATLRYTVADAKSYLFSSTDPDQLLRSASEACLRELAAAAAFEPLLTTDRAAFEARVWKLIASRVDAASLGIRIEGVTLHDLHPPAEVVQSYHAVAEAIQKRDREINEAEAEAVRVRRRAESDALFLTRNAEADTVRKTALAKAERDAFFAWHKMRTSLSNEEEDAFRQEEAKLVSDGMPKPAAEAATAAKRKRLLTTRQGLTEFRLTLAAAAGVLAGRDKIFLDSDSVPGKRTLFLADPEMLRIPGIAPNPNGDPPR